MHVHLLSCSAVVQVHHGLVNGLQCALFEDSHASLQTAEP